MVDDDDDDVERWNQLAGQYKHAVYSFIDLRPKLFHSFIHALYLITYQRTCVFVLIIHSFIH